MSFLKRFQISLESLYLLPELSGKTVPHYVVAYSGGVDSHVLLYCCKQLNLPVRAVHVHHGLQEVADDWVGHCQRICEQLSIRLDVIYVDAQKQQRQSPEEAARKARYAALKENLNPGDCLITAQHENDQAETLLLQLFRSAGPAGLSAMPEIRDFGSAVHVRPLLNFSRTEIEKFASEYALRWVEDPSNNDTSLDRNFVRKKILPTLQERWPEITSQLSNVAGLQSSNLQVLEDMAAIDLAACIQVPPAHSNTDIYVVLSMLSIPALKNFSSPRLLNVLRYWVVHHWVKYDDTDNISPTRNFLREIEKVFLHSSPDAKSKITFAGFELRKFQESLYLLKETSDKKVEASLTWHSEQALSIPGLNVQLSVIEKTGAGLKSELLGKTFSIRFRQGGEKFHPVGRRHSQSLKKLFQEAGVPPWQRDVVPLLYLGDELIAVIGLWVSRKYAVGEGDIGWDIDVSVL
ncbi:MAG: tRNA lysidine(34) synthetase TilS [Proteobacteria bacterium]|nr:tRNA lysidine(34) synthetase TilS [Pseudomonadota bacterium]